MFVLLESTHEGFIEHLGQQLSACGIDCHLLAMGRAEDGELHFALRLPLYSQMARARELLYRDRLFALRIDPVHQPMFQTLRAEPRQNLLRWLSSPKALYVSAVCLVVLVLGSLIEHFWR